MSAQSGTAIVLGYRAQGRRQSGAAVLLQSFASTPGRRLAVTFGVPWTQSQKSQHTIRAVMPAPRYEHAHNSGGWARGRGVQRSALSVWSVTQAVDKSKQGLWARYLRTLSLGSVQPWLLALPADAVAAAPWARYDRQLHIAPVLLWSLSRPADIERFAQWGQYAAHAQLCLTPRWALPRTADVLRHVPWTKFSRALDPGWGVIDPPGGEGPEGPDAGVIVPIRRVYMLLNSASLRRVDGNIPLPTFSLTMSLDVGSWTWGFSASLPARALSDLQPSSFGDPVELEALVNGVPYRFLAESISRERSFNDEGLRVSGRGLSAVLDTPYATTQNFTNASALTARQIVENVLTDNGVSIGWGVDWQMIDWLVPAGVWSHNGSYIGAVNNVARAAGGYVQPHASAQTLRLANLYPTAPWEWATTIPDFELPADVMVQESIAWKENARYDRVYVSGASDGGVAGMVTRAGTAGGVVAPMVVDPLITHVDAVRQRGLSLLATAGRQAMVGLSLPVLAETGVIVPGKMVRYVDGGVTRTGITRGVQVTVDMPEITQRIEVETYA